MVVLGAHTANHSLREGERKEREKKYRGGDKMK